MWSGSLDDKAGFIGGDRFRRRVECLTEQVELRP